MKRKIHNEKSRRYQARRSRVTKKVDGSDRTQLTIFRSSKHIYAQLVDPGSGKTLVTVSSRTKQVIGDGHTGNVEAAKKVGTALARAAKEKNIDSVVFNRNGFLYHGRVKALAEAAREEGLRF